MLDRTKVIKELNALADQLFVDSFHEHELARVVWNYIAADPTFVTKLTNVILPFRLLTGRQR